jgi:hypothetical protein
MRSGSAAFLRADLQSTTKQVIALHCRKAAQSPKRAFIESAGSVVGAGLIFFHAQVKKDHLFSDRAEGHSFFNSEITSLKEIAHDQDHTYFPAHKIDSKLFDGGPLRNRCN